MEKPKEPEGLCIPQGMWEALLLDPVMAVWVIFGIRLDAFQAARLRYYWWVQNVIDSSGVSSGKSIVNFLFLALRCILIPDQDVAIYYPVFSTGQNEFWRYFTRIKHPIFRSQLGQASKLEPGEEVSGDGTVHGPACWTAYFRNGNRLLMPAPSFARDAVTQASLRLNVMVVEEWTHVDASSEGINKQLIDRTTKPSWNQFHPIWGNHILYTAHAQTNLHPSVKRYKNHQRKVAAGDPTFANIAFSYKDYSDLKCHSGKSFKEEFRIEATINNKRNTCTKVEWLGQGFGVWSQNGVGWFTEDAILQCIQLGRVRGLKPVVSRAQFEDTFKGGQPA